jgi:hypothetical protein
MADTQTPTLGLVKPEVGASEDTWGDKWNANADKIDADAAATDTALAGKADKAAANTFTAAQVISVTDNANPALRITQQGTGDALRVEDSANPDATPFVVTANGNVGIGVPTPDTVFSGDCLAVKATMSTGPGSSHTFNLGYNGGWKYAGPGFGAAIQHDNSSGDLFIATAPNNAGVAGAAATLTERFRVRANGEVSAGSSAATGYFAANGPAAQFKVLAFRTNGINRWQVMNANDPETGGNAGSTFYIDRHADDGSWLGHAITIYRNSGLVVFDGEVTVPTRLNLKNAPASAVALNVTGYGASGLNWGSAWRASSDAGAYPFIFQNAAGTQVGAIQTTASSTVYGTTSDYRLKENVVPLEGAIDRVMQLKPLRFNFIAEPHKTVDGFLAHEAQSVVPEAISGGKDAMRAIYQDDPETGARTIVGEAPDYQSIDQSKLVPLLTAALQDAIRRIDAMQLEIDALKAR